MSGQPTPKPSDHAAKIALVTDSTCDLPQEAQLKYRPTTVPLHFDLGGVDYLDRVDMDAATFYTRFRAAGQLARSSQPSVGEFVTMYASLLTDHDSVISVHISARLSGTIQSATIAADTVDPARVRVIDSRHVSVGLGLVVQAAGEAILAGYDLDSAVAVTEAAARVTRVYGAIPDLEVAVRGGRVSAPAARLAGLVDLKPLIIFDEEGGTHVDGARLGYRRALRAMANRVVRYGKGHPVRLAIVHADGLEAAEYTRERLAAAIDCEHIPLVKAGAVITTHVGLGTVAVGVQRLEGSQAAKTRPGSS
jgi:DegV family protein with EDD domain